MEFIKDLNEILNTIYLICAGPVLIYIAYKGLEQIKAAKENSKITKENSKIQCKRESFKLAGEQCIYLAEKIIPMYSNFIAELEKNNSKFFDKFEIKVDKEKIGVRLKEKLTDIDLDGLEKSVYLKDLSNSLEGFSLYFASGVASEKAGYNTAGRCYCSIVEKLMPILLPEFKKGYFKNIMYLFVIWQNRCKNEDLNLKKKQLEKEIEQTTEMDIKTIGLDD